MRRIVLYLSARPNYGGAYQFWLAMLKALSQINKDHYELTVISAHPGWQPMAQSLDLNCQIIDPQINRRQQLINGFLRRLLPPSLYRQAGRLFHPVVRSVRRAGADQADLWIAQTSEIGGRLLGLSTVTPIFDLMHRFYPELPEIAAEYQNREKLYRCECRQAAMILVDSATGFEHTVRFYGKTTRNLAAKIRILPFIPPDYIYKRAEQPVPPEQIFEKYIFYPAQFWTHKNHERLIHALKAVRESGLDIHLVLSGSEQGNRQPIEALITALHLDRQVKILGYVTNEEMVYLYKNARALIMPSLFGPTNIPPLEAFALGCPVAVSNLFGMPEQVGDAALLFDPLSEADIAQCLKALWTDDGLCCQLAHRGTLKAQAWGQEQFTQMLLKYIDEYWAD